MVAVVFFVVTGAISVHGAVRVAQETYRMPDVSGRYRTCSEGIAGLYSAFGQTLASATPGAPEFRRSGGGGDVAAELDSQLSVLRIQCRNEGTEALDAFESLTLWRYRYETASRIHDRAIAPYAERALRYRSPAPQPASRPASRPGSRP